MQYFEQLLPSLKGKEAYFNKPVLRLVKTTDKNSQNIAEHIRIINIQTTSFKTNLTVIFVQAMKCLPYINSVNIWKFGSR